MPTTRRRVSRVPGIVIGAEAVAAFRAGDSVLLNRLLGLRVWQQGPLDVIAHDDIEADPTPITPQTGWNASVPYARALLLELQRAVGEE